MRNELSTTPLRYSMGDSLPIDLESVSIFEHRCSSLLERDYKSGDTILTCCSENQLIWLNNLLKLIYEYVKSCDVCEENIQTFYCSILCRKDQSDFGQAHYYKSNETIFDGVSFTLSNQYVETLFNSCKDVKNPVNKLSLLQIICDNTPKSFCHNPTSFIKGLLSKNIFNITPIVVDISNVPISGIPKLLDLEPYLCNQSYIRSDRIINKCPCRYCEASCFNIVHLTPDVVFRIFHLFTRFQLTFGIVFIFLICMCIYVAVKSLMQRLEESNISESDEREFFIHRRYLNHMPGEDYLFQTYNPDETKVAYLTSRFIQEKLYQWGILVASHKILFLIFPLIMILILNFGILKSLRITSSSIDAWSSSNSILRKHKNYFDENFGPYYRTQQIIVKASNTTPSFIQIRGKNQTIGPIFNFEIILAIFKIQDSISKLSVEITDESRQEKLNITLNDICYKALGSTSSFCTLYSITQYFTNDLSRFQNLSKISDLIHHIYNCVLETYINGDTLSCLSDISTTNIPEIIFGGYEKNPLESNTFVITYLVNNYIESSKNDHSEQWEQELIKFLKNYTSPLFEISFNTERSMDDEIKKSTLRELNTILGSYGIMILYITLALGKITAKSHTNFFVEQKFTLSVLAVTFTLSSVIATLGIFCYFKCIMNTIALNIALVLVLTFGMDNIFFLVHEFRRVRVNSPSTTTVKTMIGETFAGVGYIIVINNIAQIFAAAIGFIFDSSLIRNISKSLLIAMIINFFTQMTLFICIFTMDCIREIRKSPDIFWWIKLQPQDEEYSNNPTLEKILEQISQYLLYKKLKPFILLIFIISWGFCIIAIPSIKTGFDKTSVLSHHSYLARYFDDQSNRLKTSYPIFFMVYPDYEYKFENEIENTCSESICNSISLSDFIQTSLMNSKYTKIALFTTSWIRNYYSWMQPSSKCCKYILEQKYKISYNDSPSDPRYEYCLKSFESGESFLTVKQFSDYLPWYLEVVPNRTCPNEIRTFFGKAVRLNFEYYKKNSTNARPVLTSAFVAYHTPISSSDDIIKAIKAVLSLSKSVSEYIKHEVIPYSPIYNIYESYFTIWNETLISFVISFAITTIINLLLYGFQFRMTLLMTFLTYIMIVADVGAMYVFEIPLNSISLFNLIMFVALNTKFLSYTGRIFMSVEFCSREAKAKLAFIYTGSTILSGVTMTQIIGVFILLFSDLPLFRHYFFKMYACAILIGTLHALIILPILLSYFGAETPQNTTENEEIRLQRRIEANEAALNTNE